jgi:hypothetical protein
MIGAAPGQENLIVIGQVFEFIWPWVIVALLVYVVLWIMAAVGGWFS